MYTILGNSCVHCQDENSDNFQRIVSFFLKLFSPEAPFKESHIETWRTYDLHQVIIPILERFPGRKDLRDFDGLLDAAHEGLKAERLLREPVNVL